MLFAEMEIVCKQQYLKVFSGAFAISLLHTGHMIRNYQVSNSGTDKLFDVHIYVVSYTRFSNSNF